MDPKIAALFNEEILSAARSFARNGSAPGVSGAGQGS